MEGLTNPFSGVDLTGAVGELGSNLLGAVTPLIGPIVGIGLSIAAIPMGLKLFKRLTSRAV